MDNLIPFIAIVNDNITASIQSTLVQQLFITSVLSITDFDTLYQFNPSYVNIIHATNQRVLVLSSFSDSMYTTYSDIVDLCFYCKNGLMYIEKNKLGPRCFETEIKNVQIFELIHKRNCELIQEEYENDHGRHSWEEWSRNL